VDTLPGEVKVDYGAKMNILRAISKGYATFVPMPGAEDNQCFITLHQYLDAAGRIPAKLMNSKIPQALSVAMEIREEFARDKEVDAAERIVWKRRMDSSRFPYSSDEDELMGKVASEMKQYVRCVCPFVRAPPPLSLTPALLQVRGSGLQEARL
jgi:hypothetical protein